MAGSGIAQLLPPGEQQFADGNGVPYVGGFVYMYVPPATTTFKDTWQDRDESVLNQNPVPLDSAGRAVIFGDGQYRQVLTDQFGALVWDKLVEYISGANATWPLVVFVEGKPTADEVFPIVWPERALQLPVGLAGSQFHIAINPTGALVVLIQKNGTNIGQVSFAVDGTPTVTFAALIPFVPGTDNISLVFPHTPDATGAGISLTLVFQVL